MPPTHFGHIQQFAVRDSGADLSQYPLTLTPRLQSLSLRVNQRIFQNLSVEQISAQVLKEIRAAHWRAKTHRHQHRQNL